MVADEPVMVEVGNDDVTGIARNVDHLGAGIKKEIRAGTRPNTSKFIRALIKFADFEVSI